MTKYYKCDYCGQISYSENDFHNVKSFEHICKYCFSRMEKLLIKYLVKENE